MASNVRLFPLGDSALTVEFGTALSPDINAQAVALAEHFETHPFDGFVEAFPAYSSCSIFYDPLKITGRDPEHLTAFDHVAASVMKAITGLQSGAFIQRPVITIPFSTEGENAPDLENAAELSNISPEELIRIFASREYRVYMLGFLPGFAYMGDVDASIALPRLSVPRRRVEAGSIGIAGTQTGIYSLASSGGWQIIGRTNTELYRPNNMPPSYLKAGDVVRFVLE